MFAASNSVVKSAHQLSACQSLIQVVFILLTVVCPIFAGAQSFGPECSTEGTLEIVEDTASWADNCFAAITGRYPSTENIGESRTLMRDIDLDGTDEVLELRGTGNITNPIYVFKKTDEGNLYLGHLIANTTLEVVPDESGNPIIQYMYRFSTYDPLLVEVHYVDREFVTIQDLERDDVYELLRTRYEDDVVRKFDCSYSNTTDLWYCIKPNDPRCIDCTIHQYILDKASPEFPAWQILDG